MSARSRLTLFGRLYIYIVIGVCAAITSVKFALDESYRSDEFIYFLGASNYIVESIIEAESNIPQQEVETHEQIPLPKPYSEGFVAAWINSSIDISTICPQCNYLKTTDNAEYYYMRGDDGLVIFSYPDNPNRLLIADTKELSLDGSLIKREIIDDLFPYLLAGIVSLFVGFTIYWPIRQLQTQIGELIDKHHSFGGGHLQEVINEDLDKPLDELAISFNSMARSIESSVKESQIFSQAISHELRTPLNRIQIASGLLGKPLSDVQKKELLNDIDRYIEDINALISQIVSLSRLNASLGCSASEPDINTECLNLKTFIEDRIADISPQTEKHINMDIDEQISLNSNPIVLRLLTDNLISNAIKYANQHIAIHGHVSETSILFSITDDGPGIPEKSHEDIFIPFSRLDSSRSRKTGGLGLGLTIAKSACNCLNGEISITASAPGCTTFQVSIPLKTAFYPTS